MKNITFALIAMLGIANAAQAAVLAEADFDGTDTWNYTTESAFFDNGWDSDGYYGIVDAATWAGEFDYAGFSGNVLGVNDLDDEGDNGNSGIESLTFDSVNISNYENVTLSFDYDLSFAGTELVRYQVFVDSSGQGLNVIATTAGDYQGTISVPVTAGAGSVYIELEYSQNGAADVFGFDNFSVQGDVIPEPATMAVLGIGGVAMAMRRRNAKKA